MVCLLQEEPGANGTEILNCLKYVRPGHGFEPNFELTAKIDVNGPNEHPLYSFLKVRVILRDIRRSSMSQRRCTISTLLQIIDKMCVFDRGGGYLSVTHSFGIPKLHDYKFKVACLVCQSLFGQTPINQSINRDFLAWLK